MIHNLFSGYDFSVLKQSGFKEDSVREELIQPILQALGYSASGENKIIRSKALKHPFVPIGSKQHRINIIPDYLMLVQDEYAWVLDAKSPREDVRSEKNVGQAYSYAIHPHVRVKLFALCNGKEFVLFHIDREDPVLHFQLQEIGCSWEKLYELLSPQAFKNKAESQTIASPDSPSTAIHPLLGSHKPSVLVIGHRLDADVQCVLWDEDEPNMADYDIVIVDLTIHRKPLLPFYRPRLWHDPQFNISSYLNWTHTRSRIESLVLSGGKIFFIIDSSLVKHIDSPASYDDEYSKLLPFTLYGERTPSGTSVEIVDSRFDFYFRSLGSWNFIFSRQVHPEFEHTSNYEIRVQPIAQNRANESLGISIEVNSHKLSKPGWIHILPKPSSITSLEATKLLVSHQNIFA